MGADLGESVDDDADGTDESEGEDDAGSESETGTATGVDTDDCPGGCETDTSAAQLCDVVLQDCPEGEKCVPDPQGLDEPRCVKVVGDKPATESCSYDEASREDDCDADSFCWSVTGEDRRCAAFCSIEEGCHFGQTCIEQLGPNAPALNLCGDSCDPLLGDCPAGVGCYMHFPESWACLPVLGEAGVGEACEHVQDCQANLHCIEAEALPSCAGAKCCANYCDVLDPGTACAGTPGSECVVFIADPWCEQFLGLCLSPDWPGGC